MQKYVDGELVDMTEEEIQEFQQSQLNAIDYERKRKIELAWQICTTRNETGAVSVETSEGTYQYGTDTISQENIKSVLIGVSLGVTPNPRPWTPKGQTTPIQVTHSDLILIGTTMMSAVDSNIQAYLMHKANITNLITLDEIANYDLNSGWPS